MVKKYVIIKGKPILFPIEIDHAEMVSKIIEVESAGFFSITYDDEKQKLNVICSSESTSLSIRCRPEIDQKIISDFLKISE